MNVSLHANIYEKEIMSTLSSFQKDRSLGIDGLAFEFYTGSMIYLKTIF
jgi:hypothetical protein